MANKSVYPPQTDDQLPTVSIVIPVFNGAKTIRKCLDAIQNLNYPKNKYEVIVVDNNSTDSTPDIVREYPVRLEFEREIQGPHAATNTGVRVATGEILAFTDSDCVPEINWLRNLVCPFQDEKIVGVGGRIEAYNPTTRIERFLNNEIRIFKNCVSMDPSFPAAIITGNASYRADDFRAVGMFNRNLYTGSEVDLAFRIQLITGKVVTYADNAVVYHIFSPTIRRMFRHFKIYGYSEIILATIYRKYPGYPRSPRKQSLIMLKQIKALFTYLLSFVYRSIVGRFKGEAQDYITSPMLWLVAESGNIWGKIMGIYHTRFYTKQFWEKGPKVI